MTILGIDPGTATTGYGLLKQKKGNFFDFNKILYGTIKTEPHFSDAQRLKKIVKNLEKIIKEHKPNYLAIEKIFFFKNVKTIITVSQARGAIILTAAQYRLRILEFTPLEIKLTIVGYGKAEKIQVQKMVKKILRLKKMPKSDDAADGLAIALCGFYFLKSGLSNPFRNIKDSAI